MAAGQHELNRLEVLKALRISNWEAVWSTIHFSLTNGAFQTGYALWLGASNVSMGVLSSIPTFSGLIQVASSYWVERRGERKYFTAWFSVAGRLLWVPILLIPFVLPTASRFTAFLALFLLSSVLISVPIPAFLSWMSDLVPPDNRGRYFARRSMLAGIVATVVSLPAAWFLDLAAKGHRFPQAVGFGVLFGVAAACGVASFLCLLRQPEPRMQRAESEGSAGVRGLLAFYRAPFAEPNFRRFLVFSALFAAAQFFAAPFYTVYALEVLRLNYVWLQALGAVASAASLASMPLWGYLSDKYGNKPLLGIAVFGVGLLPVSWVFTSPERFTTSIVILLLINVGGLFWAGVGLTQFNLLIAITPAERKSVYIAALSAVAGLAGGLAPIVGGLMMTWLADAHVHVLGLVLSNYHLVFATNTALRFIALLSLGAVVDPGASTARTVLTQLGTARMGAFMQIRRLQRSSSESGRRRAAKALRTSRTALAVEELITALDDPSLQVREESAEALGEIGDPRAVDALVARLGDPSSGLVDEAAEALGRIGDARAVDPLVALLGRAERADQIAAVRALGRLEASAALPALVDLLRRSAGAEDAEVAEAAARALGAIGDAAAVPALVGCLDGSLRGVRMAAIRSLGEIGDAAAAAPLLRLLAGEQDGATIVQVAVALGLTGSEQAVRPLLDALDRVNSPVARKQLLNAVGALMGEGESFYPLLTLEAYARDEAVARMLGDLERRARAGGEGFGARRRGRQFSRVLELYTAGAPGEAVNLLARLRPPDIGSPAGSALAWAAETSARRALEPEEFLLALFAFGRLAP